MKTPLKGAQGARKVKTGCLTCKVRHKKCDERKPACSQCLGTGRKCDFLSAGSNTDRSQLYLHPRPVPGERSFTNYESSITPHSVLDTWYFAYFRVVYAKHFSQHLGNHSWEALVLRAVATERCVSEGAIALGALSSHLVPSNVSGQPVLLFGFPSTYSLKKYNLAIQSLHRQLAANSHRNWEVAVLGSLIFSAIEGLRGNKAGVQMHIGSALAILESHERGNNTGSTLTGPDISQALQTLDRLSSGSLGIERHYISTQPRFPVLPALFVSADEARDSLNSIAGAKNYLCWKGTATARSGRSSTEPLPPTLARDVTKLLNLLKSWQTRFASFAKGHASAPDVKFTICLRLLLIHHRVLHICVTKYLSACETGYDAHKSDFTYILDLALEILGIDALKNPPDSGIGANHAFDVALVQPLFFVACKCRQPMLRRRAVESLEKIDGLGLYDTRMIAEAARWAITMEEKTLPKSVDAASQCNTLIQEENRLLDLDIEFGPASGVCQITAWRKRGGAWLKISGSVWVG
ncbi:hypothetical protein PGQ11_001163 [Apiospora arundinis]|uniref:Zn(2)-C6 fungal-type domain-containing protein n=1 Tax=Apiospora arundinis TaxID=335852 RepID=A0ABR2JLX3_9PEZI